MALIDRKSKEPKYFQIMRLDNTEMFVISYKYNSGKDIILDSESNVLEFKQLKTERERKPLAFTKGAVFSAEEIDKVSISSFNKLWEIL